MSKDATNTSKKRLMAGGAAIMVGLSSVGYISAVAATATLPILARIIRAIEITINTSLDFGTLAITNDIAGLATLDPLSGDLRIDGSGGLALAGGVPRAGVIKIKGAPIAVNVSVETNNIQLTNGTTFLTVNDFNFQTANKGPQITITPSGPGNSALIPVGASINTRPGQLEGTYIGTSRIIANYQ